MKHALKPLDPLVVVISGIGLCTALLAAERGAKVALAARNGAVLDIVVAAAVSTPYPHRVAEAILAAATAGGCDVHVGAMAQMNTAMPKLMPRVMDRLAPRYVRKQQEDAPPHDPEGRLFRPVPHNAGHVCGHPPC